MLAERHGLDVQEAFETLRHYARNHNLRLADLAQGVVDMTNCCLSARSASPW